jgi:hypothetical protein
LSLDVLAGKIRIYRLYDVEVLLARIHDLAVLRLKVDLAGVNHVTRRVDHVTGADFTKLFSAA